eukprot:Protomagalhaensia_wolfi_Nauph_80__5255@NODE_566_length_2279_cov_719_388839_g422_i0_p1_GENE_NODE_566_length_2279_cov_719_388839_g422_i0NODE_566_length_2279_cov_719_388839_g422_i0_p1_ORF_typecomplete_len216_score33_54_NODE_566_length_2279_cov_719_388839_g422_i011061753
MPRTVVSDCTEQHSTPATNARASTQGGISDSAAASSRPYGLPSGLWRSECSALSWGESETPFMFFRNKASLSEMLTALPALLLTLPSGGGIQNSVSVPAVECEDEDGSSSQQGESDFEITDVANAASSAMPIQRISFPLYSEEDEIEDILIERTHNSFRVLPPASPSYFPLCFRSASGLWLLMWNSNPLSIRFSPASITVSAAPSLSLPLTKRIH